MAIEWRHIDSGRGLDLPQMCATISGPSLLSVFLLGADVGICTLGKVLAFKPLELELLACNHRPFST